MPIIDVELSADTPAVRLNVDVVANGAGYRTAYCVVGVTAVDGTATDLALIFEDYYSGGTGNVPLHWRAITPSTTNVSVSALVGQTVIVPTGTHVGMYVVNAVGTPWTPLAVLTGELVLVSPLGNRNSRSVWYEGRNSNGTGGGNLVPGPVEEFHAAGMDAAYVAFQSPEPGTDLYSIVETDGYTTVEELLTQLDKIKPRRWSIKAYGAAFSLTAGQIDGDPNNFIGLGVNAVFNADPRDTSAAAGLVDIKYAQVGDYVMVTFVGGVGGAPLGLYKVASPYWEHVTSMHLGDLALITSSTGAAFEEGAYFLYVGDDEQVGGWHYPMWGQYLAGMGSHANVYTQATGTNYDMAANESDGFRYGTVVWTGTGTATLTLPSATTYYGKTITVVNTDAAATITVAAKSGQSILNGVTTLHGTNYEVRQYRAITTTGWIEV